MMAVRGTSSASASVGGTARGGAINIVGSVVTALLTFGLTIAITRAKDLLYLTYPIEIYDRGVGVILGKPSRFIAEVNEDLLEPIALVDEDVDG